MAKPATKKGAKVSYKKKQSKAPPKAKARPAAPKKKPAPARQLQSAGRAAASFDPTNVMVPPAATPYARVFPINQTVRFDYDTELATRAALFVTGFGGYGTVAYLVTPNTTASTVGITPYNIPLLTPSSVNGGPTSSKISKIGMRATNSTPMQFRGGRCFGIKLDQRIKLPAGPSTLSAISWSQALTTLKALPEDMCVSYDAADFGVGGSMKGKSIYAQVDDEVDYAAFENHTGTVTGIDDFFQHIAVWPGSVELARPMSTLVFIMEPPAAATNAQNFSFNIDGQWLTRWAVDTVPGQSAITLPAASTVEVSVSRTGAQANVRGGTR